MSIYAQNADRFANVEVTATPVTEGIYMLQGAGGNIAASIGSDGTLIVDDQFAPLGDKIIASLKSVGGSTPRMVVNTHWHGDHTGSNPQMGEQATIVSHDNVRVRLAGIEDYPRTGLPLVTYSDALTLHFNDQTIALLHLPAGHTDGDSAVWFKQANVIHMGDHFFVRRFPYVDAGSGGTIQGFISNVRNVLAKVPEDIQIIPGHGPLASTQDLSETIAVVESTANEIMTRSANGEDDAAIANWLDNNYPTWGSGFINAQRWVQIVKSATAK